MPSSRAEIRKAEQLDIAFAAGTEITDDDSGNGLTHISKRKTVVIGIKKDNMNRRSMRQVSLMITQLDVI